MTRIILLLFFLFTNLIAQAQYKYPFSKTVDSSNTWYNVTVKDPYRWLENMKDKNVEDWYKSQNNLTDSILNTLSFSDSLFSLFKQVTKQDIEQKQDTRQFGNSIIYFAFSTNNKLSAYRKYNNQNNPKIIASSDIFGNNFNITFDWQYDPSNKFLAIVAQESGKEFNYVKIYDIVNDKILEDSIYGSFKGFLQNQPNTFYYLYCNPNDLDVLSKKQAYVYKSHKIGTDNSTDVVITSLEKTPELMDETTGKYIWEISTFKGCNYEFAGLAQATESEIWYRQTNSNDKWMKLFAADEKVISFCNINNYIYYFTYQNASNGKVMQVNLANPLSSKKIVIPEQDIPLDIEIVGNFSNKLRTKNYLIIPYVRNGRNSITKFFHLPTQKIVANPFKTSSTKTVFLAKEQELNDTVAVIRVGWLIKNKYSFGDINSGKEKPNPFRLNSTNPFENILVVKEVEVPSYDGTLVPLTIIYRKDLKFNGNNVAIIDGYAAYGMVTPPPIASMTTLALANKGIVICYASPRGGGEKGDNWHIGGLKQSKPNSWKDFNACAEWLIKNGYTSKNHLACAGGSAGGILVGRAVTERPDLWSCANIDVGLLNVLRSEYSALGKSNADEFGTTENINDFFSMMENDALLHIQNGIKYPAMYITTGWNDPRVSSWQCAKFAAAAQNATTSSKPILLKVNFNGGHFGEMTDINSGLKAEAKKYAFILSQCDFETANIYD